MGSAGWMVLWTYLAQRRCAFILLFCANLPLATSCCPSCLDTLSAIFLLSCASCPPLFSPPTHVVSLPCCYTRGWVPTVYIVLIACPRTIVWGLAVGMNHNIFKSKGKMSRCRMNLWWFWQMTRTHEANAGLGRGLNKITRRYLHYSLIIPSCVEHVVTNSKPSENG